MTNIIRTRAPLRLGLAGGGTDVSPYCEEFGGAVLNATIDRYAFASFEPRTDGKVVFRATDLNIEDEINADGRISLAHGLRLHRGAYVRMISQFNDSKPIPMTLTTYVESPVGSGLGSSSALMVAMIEVLREVVGAPLGEYDTAHLAFEVERKDLNLNGGRQDQYAATFGGFNFMEFSGKDRVIVNPLRIRDSTAHELEASLVLFFTGVSRQSAMIIDNQADAVSSGGASLDAMHQLKRDAVAMKEALLFGRVRDIATILDTSWQAKKLTSPAVSNRLIDDLIKTSKLYGALAGKVSGAGGGGFIMFLVDPVRRAELMSFLTDEAIGTPITCRFTTNGAHTWRVR